jgi:hypothetical protein
MVEIWDLDQSSFGEDFLFYKPCHMVWRTEENAIENTSYHTGADSVERHM